MRTLAFLCLLLVAAWPSLSGAQTVQPLFTCWFTSHESGSAIVSVVLGYNNTFSQSQIISSTNGNNAILPANYDQFDHSIFRVGYVFNAFAVADSLGVLQQPTGAIQWTVRDQTVSVTGASLTPQNQCATLYANTCALNIANFCSDGLYCTGQEVCRTPPPSTGTPATTGQCVDATQPVTCANSSFQCSETALACVPSSAAPTDAATLAAEVTANSAVQPIFSCWFRTYGAQGQWINNLVMGYNNSLAQPQNITTGATTLNIILPANYDDTTQAQYEFAAGYVQNAFVITDSLNVLAQGGDIQWNVNNLTVNVVGRQLVAATQCSNRFPTTCSADIANFCADSLYCNGQEACVAGVCTASTAPIVCGGNPPQQCSEAATGCVPAPTATPTAVSATPAPTKAPTSAAPTRAPTSAPTSVAATPTVGGCLHDSDCDNMDTFCDGAYVCDVGGTAQCVRQNAQYDPCATMRNTLESLYNASHNDTVTFPLSIVCVEPQGCVLVTLNDEVTITAPTMAPVPSATPAPTWPDDDDDDDDSNAAMIVGIIAGVLLGIGLIVLFLVLLYECSVQNSYLDSTALAVYTMQSTLNSRRQAALNGRNAYASKPVRPMNTRHNRW
jgi:hypothetical protein